jgi:hypothetical protein
MSDPCRHPFDRLVHEWWHRPALTSISWFSGAWCGACESVLWLLDEVHSDQTVRSRAPARPKTDWKQFVAFRNRMFQEQTGADPTKFWDMMGNEIKIGSLVVYPVMSGRSCQIALGKVLSIEEPTKTFNPDDSWRERALLRMGAPLRVKVQPQRVHSRWNTYYSNDGTGSPKAVTLTANAPSVVVVG